MAWHGMTWHGHSMAYRVRQNTAKVGTDTTKHMTKMEAKFSYCDQIKFKVAYYSFHGL